MGIISYAQNFEDVLLWRALGHIQQGCYIDIGAHDPVVDSVSRAFYEHGWRGIHLEPLPVYCNALRLDRPDETVLQAAVAAETGVLRFYEIPDTGISTGDEVIAQSHRERGFQINEIAVPCVTLAQVFQLVQGDVVHWLKIDVEGFEEQVLKGWGESSLRPWIVVVESTLPLTQNEVFSTWEGLLKEKGYTCVHFDGLNRYYLAAGHHDLEAAFRCGPNVFDGFQLYGSASNTFTKHVAKSLRNELGSQIESLKQELLQCQIRESDCAARFAEEITHLESIKKALQAEQVANLQNQNSALALELQFCQQFRQETEVLLQQAIQREKEFSAQLLAAKEQFHRLTNEHAARELLLHERLADSAQQFAQALAQQVQESKLCFDEQMLTWNTQERMLRQEVSDLTSQLQALRHAKDLQNMQHGFAMDARLGEQQRLIESFAALESRFKLEIAAEQQTSLQLRQELAEVQLALAKTYASFVWRFTAPLRAICLLFAPKQSGSPSIAAASNVILPPVAPFPSVSIQNSSPEPSVLPMSAIHSNMSTTVASTLDELLAYHDQSFVVCAYHTLLRRAPDPEGLSYYTARLRSGIAKIQILAQLQNSSEGKAHKVALPGLAHAIRRFQRRQYPLIGWMFTGGEGAEGNNPGERRLRAIENRLLCMAKESSRRFDLMDRAFAELDRSLQDQTKLLAALSTQTIPDEKIGAANRVSASERKAGYAQTMGLRTVNKNLSCVGSNTHDLTINSAQEAIDEIAIYLSNSSEAELLNGDRK